MRSLLLAVAFAWPDAGLGPQTPEEDDQQEKNDLLFSEMSTKANLASEQEAFAKSIDDSPVDVGGLSAFNGGSSYQPSLDNPTYTGSSFDTQPTAATEDDWSNLDSQLDAAAAMSSVQTRQLLAGSLLQKKAQEDPDWLKDDRDQERAAAKSILKHKTRAGKPLLLTDPDAIAEAKALHIFPGVKTPPLLLPLDRARKDEQEDRIQAEQAKMDRRPGEDDSHELRRENAQLKAEVGELMHGDKAKGEKPITQKDLDSMQRLMDHYTHKASSLLQTLVLSVAKDVPEEDKEELKAETDQLVKAAIRELRSGVKTKTLKSTNRKIIAEAKALHMPVPQVKMPELLVPLKTAERIRALSQEAVEAEDRDPARHSDDASLEADDRASVQAELKGVKSLETKFAKKSLQAVASTELDMERARIQAGVKAGWYSQEKADKDIAAAERLFGHPQAIKKSVESLTNEAGQYDLYNDVSLAEVDAQGQAKSLK